MEVTLERFARTMDKLFRPPYPSLVCIAVSGGVDSMALTHLATRYFQPRGVGVRALIVDHALRAESSQEAERVRGLVDAMGAEARVLRMHWAPGELASSMARFELAARDKRLALLSDACTRRGARHLLLAHTQDDQLETLLMRLTRGSSLRGLAGMRATRAFWRTPPPPQDSATSLPPLQLVKPLLECAKSDLYATCRAHGVEWAEDPTNHDATFTSRNAIREVLKDETLLPAALHREALIETLQAFQRKREDFETEARELVRALITSGGASVNATFGQVTFQEFTGLRHARTSALALALQHLTARIAPFEGDGYTFSIFFRIAQRIKQLDLAAGQARFSAANLDWVMTSRVQTLANTGGLPQSIYTWKVTRQKPPRWSTGELKAFRAKLSGDWTPYKLFDNRYWVRVRICGHSSAVTSNTKNDAKEPRKYMKLTELKKYQREQERQRQKEQDRLASTYRTVVIKYPNLRVNDREFLDKCLPPPGESDVISAAVRAQVTAKIVLVQPTVFVHKRESVPLEFVPVARKDAAGDASPHHQSGRPRLVRPEEDPANYDLVGCPLLLGAAASQPGDSVTVPLPDSHGLRLEIECRLKQVDDAVEDAIDGEGVTSLRVPEQQSAAADDAFKKRLEKHQEILNRIKF